MQDIQIITCDPQGSAKSCKDARVSHAEGFKYAGISTCVNSKDVVLITVVYTKE